MRAHAKKKLQLATARRLLVPVDLSPLSDQALDLALRLSGPRARILLFHASAPVHTPAVYGPEGAMVPVYDKELSAMHLARCRKELARRVARHRDPRLQAQVVEDGQAARAVAVAARRFKADLVVLTTHGRGGLSRLFFGSVAQRLFHLYRGPILALRPGHSR